MNCRHCFRNVFLCLYAFALNANQFQFSLNLAHSTHSDKFCCTLSVSTVTPGGGSLIRDINSLCNRRCGWGRRELKLVNDSACRDSGVSYLGPTQSRAKWALALFSLFSSECLKFIFSAHLIGSPFLLWLTTANLRYMTST